MRLCFLRGEPHRPAPHTLRAQRQRRRDLASVADATRGEHRRRRDRVDHFGNEHHRADLAGSPAFFDADVLRRHEYVDTVGTVADLALDPVELHVEGVWGEGDGPEDTQTARLRHCRDHVATVTEGEDREFDAEKIADRSAHAPQSARQAPSRASSRTLSTWSTRW